MSWVLYNGKVFKHTDMKPKSNCPDCGGCGYVAYIRPDLIAEYREMRPCACVKKVVKVKHE